MMSKIEALSVIPSLAMAYGGPAFSVSALAEAAGSAGVSQSIITFRAPAGRAEQTPSSELVTTIRVGGVRFQTIRFFWSPVFGSTLRRFCRERGVQVIQSHGIWTQPNHLAARVARELGLPLIVSPHGNLEPWAWRHNAWKKRPAWRLWVKADIQSAVVFRATAQKEASAIRARGLRQPIAVIPNAVHLPPVSPSLGCDSQKPRYRTALFLSRCHPSKGLLPLVAAWSKVRPDGWRMVVCGPDECGHKDKVIRAVAGAGLSASFEFRDAAYGREKEEIYAAADLFVLPTFSENFGLAIAEALAAGVPVITTTATPWEELRSHQCGWWIDSGVEALVAALDQATRCSDEQRRSMGRRGRQLIEQNYSWPNVGRKMKAVYAWVLGQAPRPDYVIAHAA